MDRAAPTRKTLRTGDDGRRRVARERGGFWIGFCAVFFYPVGWLSALIGFEWSTGRSFCRDLCPMGTLLTWTSKLNPFIKPTVNPDKCVPCKACSRACPEGLNLSNPDIDKSPCSKCFACQMACPRDAVQLKLIGKNLEINQPEKSAATPAK